MRRVGVLVSVGLALLPLLAVGERFAAAQRLQAAQQPVRGADLDLPPEDRPGNRPQFRCPYCGLPTFWRVTQKSQCANCSRLASTPPEVAAEFRAATSPAPGPAAGRPGGPRTTDLPGLSGEQPESGPHVGTPAAPLQGSGSEDRASGLPMNAPPTGGKQLLVIGVGLVALLVAVYCAIRFGGGHRWLALGPWRVSEKLQTHVCRCPKCKGKTRYATRLAGTLTKCSRCGWSYSLPVNHS
jgi:hypothetical protein